MFSSSLIKNALVISCASHLALFGIFSVSFGHKLPLKETTAISNWGQILSGMTLGHARKESIVPSGQLLILRKSSEEEVREKFLSIFMLRQKPLVSLGYRQEKLPIPEDEGTSVVLLKRKEATLVFHPLLPYSFPLYFKDRQVAHVELFFRISAIHDKTMIEVKRKISSGSLEVDLLSARYIKHYLFIQQSRFTRDTWQTVRIDLSA